VRAWPPDSCDIIMPVRPRYALRDRHPRGSRGPGLPGGESQLDSLVGAKTSARGKFTGE
jgi:hypothetical protein